MKAVGLWIAKGVGALFIVAAILQWLTFDYPNVSPWGVSIFSPGMFGQFVNWIIVCVLGAVGAFLWTLGGSSSKKPDSASNS
jgi:multisubunit Na+/H+ antiporter MnhB subunit